MKVTERKYDIELTDQFKTKTFGMEINAKAFDILVNKIYTDKVGAIVRELSANAYDSHVDAGKLDIPFSIHLPNAMEPYFHIRDFGTGISEEKMYEVYTTVFRSDKTGSNEFVGCMGLGSKTPFCYTDQFTIISYYNGVQYCYFAHKDSRGIPSISASVDNGTPTNEPNGLKVSFAVKNNHDFLIFALKTEYYLRYYKVRPTISGNTCKFPMESVIYEDDDFRILSSKDTEASILLMGNIPYNMCCNMQNIIFKAKIGEIEIEASRERIEDVEHNTIFIHQQSTKAKSILLDIYNYQKRIYERDATCNWEKHTAHDELHKIMSDFIHGLSSEFTYNMPYGTCKHQDSSNLRYKSRVWNIKPRPVVDIKNIIPSTGRRGRVLFLRYSNDNQLKKRQGDWLTDNFGDTSIISFTADKEQEIITYFEINPEFVVDVADVPSVPIKPRVKKATVPISGWKRFRGSSNYQGRCWISENTFDITKHPLCCRKNHAIEIGQTNYSPVFIHKILKTIDCHETFYGLNVSEYKRYIATNKVIDFQDWIKLKLSSFITTYQSTQSAKATYLELDYDDKNIYNFIKGSKDWIPKKILNDIGGDNFIPITTSYNEESKYTQLYIFAKKLDINFTIKVNQAVLDGIKKYKEKYSMIELVSHAPEHRDEFFRLFLGDKNATKN